MVEVKIKGLSDRVLREKLRSFAFFAIKELMPRKRRLFVQINVLTGMLEKDGMLGSCMPEDWAVNKRHYEFEICLDSSMDYPTMVSILGHEIGHVRQYACGELLYDSQNPDITIWKGKRYTDESFTYENMPWEKDAVKKEIHLREKWLA